MKYANRLGWSDIHPYEVVKQITPKTLEVRRMESELDPNWKPEMVAGGFVAHTTNNHEQKWVITPDPDAATFRIRLRKNGHFYDKHGNKYALSTCPVRFYDYNF